MLLVLLGRQMASAYIFLISNFTNYTLCDTWANIQWLSFPFWSIFLQFLFVVMCQGEKILTIKAKFFQEAMFLSSFSLTRSKYTAVQKDQVVLCRLE